MWFKIEPQGGNVYIQVFKRPGQGKINRNKAIKVGATIVGAIALIAGVLLLVTTPIREDAYGTTPGTFLGICMGIFLMIFGFYAFINGICMDPVQEARRGN